jgi:cation:H+ antiporter
LLETSIWFVIGLIALIGGAELLVRSVSKLAVIIGISKLIIGLIVVAFGTSAPELAVSIRAGIDGNTDLMLGNIVGSNITNTLLVLGLAALVIPLKVHVKLIRWDVPVMISVTLLVYILSLNGSISFFECILLTCFLIGYLIFLIRQGGDTDIKIRKKENRSPVKIIKYTLQCLAGFFILITGARWLIYSSLIFAEIAGVSELTIGLTVLAIGTSLPEIVVVLIAAIKGEKDIAVGSIIGSNILNFLAVLGVSGLFIPGAIPVQQSLINFDLILLLIASIFCIPIFYTGHKMVRWEGVLFLCLYFSYLFYLFLSSNNHDFITVFSSFMLYFALPLTLLTLLVFALMEWKRRFRFRNFKFNNKDNTG